MIRLAREVRFSLDRDGAGHLEFSQPVTNSWAGWPSAVGLVPYLRLRATVCGEPAPATGLLCNIQTLDDLLRRHALPCAAEVLRSHGWRRSAERLLRDIWQNVVRHAPEHAPLIHLELLLTPFLRYTIVREEPNMVMLTQQFEFSAAHRLHCRRLSNEENRRVFGKCNNPQGHGHNYLVEITVSGTPDEETGTVLPLPRFEQVVNELVIDRLDHTHLNEGTVEFRELNPSVENITRVIWGLLVGQVSPARLAKVRVYETPKTWAECAADE